MPSSIDGSDVYFVQRSRHVAHCILNMSWVYHLSSLNGIYNSELSYSFLYYSKLNIGGFWKLSSNSPVPLLFRTANDIDVFKKYIASSYVEKIYIRKLQNLIIQRGIVIIWSVTPSLAKTQVNKLKHAYDRQHCRVSWRQHPGQSQILDTRIKKAYLHNAS